MAGPLERGQEWGLCAVRGGCRQEQACSGLGASRAPPGIPWVGRGSAALPGGPGKSAGSRREEDRGGMCPSGGLKN